MRAVTIVEGELVWAEHEEPQPGDHQLVVAVRAAGLNNADVLQRRGWYPPPPGAPADIPGLELAGEVVAVGRAASRFEVGDRVMAVVSGGAQAARALVEDDCAVPVPPGADWIEAGGFPEAFSTAYDALFTQCRLDLGERVLVTGAAGGVGTAAVQLAAAAGAYVTASVRAPALREHLTQLGAARGLAPEEALEAGPYDVVLELVGGSSFPGALAAMATGGRIAVIGVGAGASCELDLLTLMHRRARISGSTLRARSDVEKAAVAGAVEAHVVPLFATGRVRVPVAATFPMEHAPDAYAHFEDGGKLGKIVMVAPEAG